MTSPRSHRRRLTGTGLFVACGLVAGLLDAAVSQDLSEPALSVAAIAVSVTASGRPVVDLVAGDFVVVENGRRVDVERLETPDVPQNVAVVVDPSPASDLGLDWVRRMVTGVATGLGSGSRLALIEAQSPPRDPVPLTDDGVRVAEAIAALTSTGRPTNRIYDRTVDAFLMLLDEGTPRGAVVVVTDGIDVGSDRGEESFLRAVRVAGLPLYVLATDNAEGYSGRLGVRAESVPGNERFRAALSDIADQSEQFYLLRRDQWRERAESSGGRFIEVGDDVSADALASAEIAAALDATYTLYFYASAPPAGSDHTPIEVRVDRPDVEVRAPAGIWWPEP